jgi:hypothetical protein
MTDTPGTEQQQPVILHQGQPWSPQMAADKRAELMANSDYAKAALAGDEAKQRELADLYMIARGVTPGGSAPPATAEDVLKGMTEREVGIELQREASWRDRVNPVTPQEVAEFERGQATASQKAAARRFIEQAKRDPGFRTKLLNNDMEARAKWARWNFVATADEIPDRRANG